MYQAIFLSKLLGLFVSIMAIFALTNKKKFSYILNQMIISAPIMLLSGCLSLLLGLYTVLTHNIWSLNFNLIVTITGWIFIFQGVLRIFSPRFFIEFMKNLIEKERFYLVAWVWFIIGIYLTYNSFVI